MTTNLSTGKEAMEAGRPYYLDSNVLLRYPDILSRRSQHPLIVTDSVLAELDGLEGRHTGIREIKELIEEAARQNLISIERTWKPVDLQLQYSTDELPIHDARLLSHLLRKQADRPILLTDDRKLIQTANVYGITAVPAADIIEEFRRNPIASSEIHGKSRRIVRIQLTHIVLSLVISLHLGVLGALVGHYIDWILERINVIVAMLSLPLIGSILFYIRGKNPIIYGGAEIIVGIATGINPILGQQLSTLNTTNALQIMAGTYIIVRGLDNLGKGLRGTRFQSLWDRIFPTQ